MKNSSLQAAYSLLLPLLAISPVRSLRYIRGKYGENIPDVNLQRQSTRYVFVTCENLPDRGENRFQLLVIYGFQRHVLRHDASKSRKPVATSAIVHCASCHGVIFLSLNETARLNEIFWMYHASFKSYYA